MHSKEKKQQSMLEEMVSENHDVRKLVRSISFSEA